MPLQEIPPQNNPPQDMQPKDMSLPNIPSEDRPEQDMQLEDKPPQDMLLQNTPLLEMSPIQEPQSSCGRKKVLNYCFDSSIRISLVDQKSFKVRPFVQQERVRDDLNVPSRQMMQSFGNAAPPREAKIKSHMHKLDITLVKRYSIPKPFPQQQKILAPEQLTHCIGQIKYAPATISKN